ncbi:MULTISPECIES: ACP S-malonyltransferase [unclassified Micromonospora]|uniref:ACP S-malonyltransferase n=1 Tax=unclassified Micromonospora TaxID=2617518 RepID=UPI003A858C7F
MAEGRTALVFPGMGPTGFAEAGRFMLANRYARELTATADEVLGYPLLERYRAGGDYSEAAQVAFLVNCLALARWSEQGGTVPDFCVGPSFGEKPLIAYVGALPVPQAIWLTAQLARRMEEYFATEHRDVVTHSFTRTPEPLLREVLDELAGQGEWHEISCYVDHDFHMLSLREHMLDWLAARLRSAGGLPLYTMRPPMHCAAFAPLRDIVAREVLDGLEFADPTVPVVADQDGTLVTTGAGVRQMLLDSFVRPLRWPDVVASLRTRGVREVRVCGPDRLFGRVRATTAAFEVVAVTPRLALQPRRSTAAG